MKKLIRWTLVVLLTPVLLFLLLATKLSLIDKYADDTDGFATARPVFNDTAITDIAPLWFTIAIISIPTAAVLYCLKFTINQLTDSSKRLLCIVGMEPLDKVCSLHLSTWEHAASYSLDDTGRNVIDDNVIVRYL